MLTTFGQRWISSVKQDNQALTAVNISMICLQTFSVLGKTHWNTGTRCCSIGFIDFPVQFPFQVRWAIWFLVFLRTRFIVKGKNGSPLHTLDHHLECRDWFFINIVILLVKARVHLTCSISAVLVTGPQSSLLPAEWRKLIIALRSQIRN